MRIVDFIIVQLEMGGHLLMDSVVYPFHNKLGVDFPTVKAHYVRILSLILS